MIKPNSNHNKSGNHEEIEAIVNKQVAVKLEQFDKMYEKTFHDQINELIEFRHAEMEIGNKQKLDQAVEVLEEKQREEIEEINSKLQAINASPQNNKRWDQMERWGQKMEVMDTKLSSLDVLLKAHVAE